MEIWIKATCQTLFPLFLKIVRSSASVPGVHEGMKIMQLSESKAETIVYYFVILWVIRLSDTETKYGKTKSTAVEDLLHFGWSRFGWVTVRFAL